MTRKEFLEKWCWAPTVAPNCHQITWDLLEEIRETFEDEALTNDACVGSACYSISNLLEVIDKSTPDYEFLSKLKAELEEEQQ